MAEHEKCDVLIVIPKHDDLLPASTVFGLDPESPGAMLDAKYEYWTTATAGLRVGVFLAGTQDNASLALATASGLAATDPAVAFCIGTAAGRKDEVSYLDVVLASAVLD